MVTSCEEIRLLLADYVTARLAPEQRGRVEQHRQTCPECGEIVSDLEIMKQQIQAGGEALFEPHPEPGDLHRYVLEGEGGPRIGGHLENCATCQLEVETWRRIGGKSSAAVAVRSRPSLPWMSLAAGVGALLGLLVGWRVLSTPAPTTPPPTIPEAQAPPAATPSREPARIAEAPVIHVLPSLLRSAETTVQHWSIDRDEPYLAIGVPISVSEEASASERYRFELVTVGGATLWQIEMPLSRVKEHMDSAGVVSLAVAPAQPLEPGRYQLRVVPAGAPGASAVYKADIEIDYRQSPEATKAPQ